MNRISQEGLLIAARIVRVLNYFTGVLTCLAVGLTVNDALDGLDRWVTIDLYMIVILLLLCLALFIVSLTLQGFADVVRCLKEIAGKN